MTCSSARSPACSATATLVPPSSCLTPLHVSPPSPLTCTPPLAVRKTSERLTMALTSSGPTPILSRLFSRCPNSSSGLKPGGRSI